MCVIPMQVKNRARLVQAYSLNFHYTLLCTMFVRAPCRLSQYTDLSNWHQGLKRMRRRIEDYSKLRLCGSTRFMFWFKPRSGLCMNTDSCASHYWCIKNIRHPCVQRLRASPHAVDYQLCRDAHTAVPWFILYLGHFIEYLTRYYDHWHLSLSPICRPCVVC